MIPDSRHFTRLAPTDFWKLAMLSGYTINAITGSDIWVVQIAFALNGPGPTLNSDVSKKSKFLVARGNYHETLQKRKSTCTPGFFIRKSLPKRCHNIVAKRLHKGCRIGNQGCQGYHCSTVAAALAYKAFESWCRRCRCVVLIVERIISLTARCVKA